MTDTAVRQRSRRYAASGYNGDPIGTLDYSRFRKRGQQSDPGALSGWSDDVTTFDSTRRRLPIAATRAVYELRVLAPQLNWKIKQTEIELVEQKRISSRLVSNSRELARAHAQFRRVAELEDGWGAYDGLAPSRLAMFTAYALISQHFTYCQESSLAFRKPWHVAPMPDGGLQLEWRRSGTAAAIEISPIGIVNYILEIDDEIVEETDEEAGASIEAALGLLQTSIVA